MSELDYISLNLDQQQLITTEQAWHYAVVPKGFDKTRIELYIDEQKYNKQLKDELEILLGKEIILEKISPAVIQKTIVNKNRKKNVNHIKKNINKNHKIHNIF